MNAIFNNYQDIFLAQKYLLIIMQKDSIQSLKINIVSDMCLEKRTDDFIAIVTQA